MAGAIRPDLGCWRSTTPRSTPSPAAPGSGSSSNGAPACGGPNWNWAASPAPSSAPMPTLRYPLEIFRAVRAVWPGHKPFGVRVSATDWIDGGWDVDETVAFARELKPL